MVWFLYFVRLMTNSPNKMKKCLFLILVLLSAWGIHAQNVQFKKNTVWVDGKEVFSYKGDMSVSEYHFYKLNTTDEVVYLKYDRNGTFEYDGDNFTRLFFPIQNVRIETKALYFGLDGKPIIKKLFAEGVIRADGTIDEEKLKTFVGKYSDYITK